MRGVNVPKGTIRNERGGHKRPRSGRKKISEMSEEIKPEASKSN